MIYNELKELNSPLADIPNINVFTVPEGYFAALSTDIMLGINNEHLINGLDIPVLDMKVPEGYFEGLADVIMNKIKKDELGFDSEETAALLAAIAQKNVFTVPAGYFNDLPESIVSKLPKEQAKLVEMKPRPSVLKYAVAACITGMLGLSLFSIFDKKAGVEQFAHVQPVYIDKGDDILKNNNFDQQIGSIADDEIVGYLQNNGEDVNAALVASLTDEKNLPNEDAYYIDEKALDNFLNEQHIAEPGNN